MCEVQLEGMECVGEGVGGSATEPLYVTLLDHHCIFECVHKALCIRSCCLSKHFLDFISLSSFHSHNNTLKYVLVDPHFTGGKTEARSDEAAV